MEGQSTSPREAYQSRHDSGHKHRIPSKAYLEFTFVQQIYAGVQDEFLKLFWRESGDIFTRCSQTEFAQSLRSLSKYLEETVWLVLTSKFPYDVKFASLQGFPKLFSPKKGLNENPPWKTKAWLMCLANTVGNLTW